MYEVVIVVVQCVYVCGVGPWCSFSNGAIYGYRVINFSDKVWNMVDRMKRIHRYERENC